MKDLGLVNYDAMTHSLAILETVDEVKEIRDKALALELYAQQAMNTEAERQACGVRLRAEKECGRRLNEMDKAQGKRTDLLVSGEDVKEKQTLSDLGISWDQSSKWQKLAQVPDDQFEAALADPDKKPSTAGILKVNGSSDRMDADALWIWGRLRDMEKRNLFECDTDVIAGEVTQAMLDDLTRMLPVAIYWLSSLERSCNE